MDQADALLFAVLAKAMKQRMDKLYAQALANTAWAFVMADQADALLFAALAKAVQQRMGELSAQNLANRGFATVDQAVAPLFAALARRTKQRIGEFNAQEFKNHIKLWLMSAALQVQMAWGAHPSIIPRWITRVKAESTFVRIGITILEMTHEG